MVERLKHLVAEETGQGMAEYALILAFVAIVVVGALTTMGEKLEHLFSSVGGEFEKLLDKSGS